MEERAAREGREVRMGAGLLAGGPRAADRGLSVRMSVFVEQRGRERGKGQNMFLAGDEKAIQTLRNL